MADPTIRSSPKVPRTAPFYTRAWALSVKAKAKAKAAKEVATLTGAPHADSFQSIKASASKLGDPASHPFAGQIFPDSLHRLDPLTYYPAQRNVLPAKQPSERLLMEKVQRSREKSPRAMLVKAVELKTIGHNKLWLRLGREYAKSMGPLKGLLGLALVGAALAAEAIRVNVEKLLRRQPRPSTVDPALRLAGPPQHGYSYPSGHAAAAYAAAGVLGRLMPGRRVEFQEIAANVARSRVYLGAHFAGDIGAGARIGDKIGRKLRVPGWLVDQRPVRQSR